VSNGVDRERFRFDPDKRAFYREKFGLTRFTVFGAGNIIPRKGITDFLDVAARLPCYDFIWYGQRWPKALAFHPQLEKRLDERPPNVRLPGFVEDAPGAYSAGDVLLFPSRTETQGLVILEAASLGRPVIVRDLPGRAAVGRGPRAVREAAGRGRTLSAGAQPGAGGSTPSRALSMGAEPPAAGPEAGGRARGRRRRPPPLVRAPR